MNMFDHWSKTLVFFVPFALILIGALVCFLLRKTLRTRLRVKAELKADTDINEYAVIFNWSHKILYVPTIIAALLAALLMYIGADRWGEAFSRTVGGGWLAVFFLNFLIEEYEVNLKFLLIVVLAVGALFLWLAYLDKLLSFLRFFKRLGIRIDPLGYLLIAGIFFLAAVVSWIRGLFYYVAITPNYLNVQAGPTETGQHIGHEDYNTTVDTGDFLERLFGFGRVGITFRDRTRMPMVLLVWRIGKRAANLEKVRSKIALDRPHAVRVAPSESGSGVADIDSAAGG
jgi:hypothetical protein